VADGGFPGGPAAAATATGVAAGTTTITATYISGSTKLSDSATLTVTQPVTPTGIRITPATATINVGDNQAYTVVLASSDGTTTPLTTGVTLTNVRRHGWPPWPRQGAGAADLRRSAVTARRRRSRPSPRPTTAGGQTFTSEGEHHRHSAGHTVGLYLTPATASVQVNGTQQFEAFATYSDGTSTAVTNNAS